MRLHDLSITAFGPFVDTVHVDFDEVAAGGVFLLTGDTGSGKTSVLDAVCFALYGEVPGDRHSARHLRSDHADPSAEPRVVLRVTIAGRRFRFTRSPAWERPKRRGSGTIRVQAHVVVEEQRDDAWVALTNRLDEAGQLVSGLLGMTCTQFTQVAMLPQGRFQTFLRASSNERHAVLQRLFRTQRFEEVERWLAERRLELGRRCRSHHDECAGVVNRLHEAAGVGVPPDWDLHDLDRVAANGALARWGEQRLSEARAALEERGTALALATSARARDQETLDAAREVTAARARGEAARTRLADLDASRELDDSLTTSLDAHRRAAPVLPLALRVETAESRHAEAEMRARAQLESVRALVGVDAGSVDADTLTAATIRLNEERAVAETWLPRELQLREERTRLRALESESNRLASVVRCGEERSDALAEAHDGVVATLAEAARLVPRAEADRTAVATAGRGLEAAAEAAGIATELEEARSRLSLTTTHAQELRQAYLDLREQRISGMAAELAGGLAVGCSCPVCGSVDHPAPARASATVSRADEEAARERFESVDFERQTVQELVATLASRHESALVRSQGRTVSHWRAAAGAAASAATESSRAERDATRLASELADLERERSAVLAELATARVSLEERTRERAETAERHDRLADELAALLGSHPGLTTVAALVDSHRRAVTDLQEARDASTALERAAQELAAATRAADTVVSEAGFGSLPEALAAVLPGGEAVSRTRQLDARRATRAAAEIVLADDSVRAALDADAPDVDALAEWLRESARARDEAHAAHDQATRRVGRLLALTRELTASLAAWAPVREDHALSAGLAALVEGKSVDNRLRMRLSAYVLSERLRQVVAAANERLGAMTDERFTLEQADERGAGEQRGGLSLKVRDEWSGRARDPVTLSGGETFIVSLALALGLADTVSHEAGGTQLDTLFIDEGFGALDAGTLDDVMDTLDSLRDGGRVVGLVSHVAELRNRVPCRLEVSKARRGSTVRALVAAH